MHSVTPSPTGVRAVFEQLDTPGTPLTTTEVAAEFDCTTRTIYNRLTTLVEEGAIRTKKVGARGRVWWQPPTDTDSSYRRQTSLDESTHSMGRAPSSRKPVAIPAGEGFYREIFNQLFQFIGLLRPNGTLLEANDAALSFGGFDRKDVIGDPFWEAPWWQTSPEVRTQLQDAIERAADGEFVRYDVEVQGDDRTAIIDFSIRPVTDGQGEVTHLIPEGRDISDLKERERQLEQQRDLLERILETSPVGIGIVDENGRFSRINQRAVEMLGIAGEKQDEIRPAQTACSASETPSVAADLLSTVLETGEPIENQQLELNVDGQLRWLSVNAAPIVEHGSVKRIVVTGEEITALKQQANRLERQRDELEAELSEVFDRVADGFVGLDDELRLTYVNDYAEELLDIEEASVRGNDIRETIPLAEEFEAGLYQARDNQKPVFREVYYESLDSWFDTAIYPSETGISYYFRDITERKTQKQQLESTTARLTALYENSPDMIDVLDPDGRLIDVNKRICLELGYTASELLGRGIWEIDQQIDAQGVTDLLSELSVDEPRAFDTCYQQADGSTFPVEVNLIRLDLDGNDRYLAISRDITERKQREQALRDQVRQQEVVTELGEHALGERDLDGLMAEASQLVAETLDNDYCKVLDLDADAEELLLRQGVGWNRGIVGSATVSAVEDSSQAAHTLSTNGPVCVEDLRTETRFSGPRLLTDHDVRGGISTIIGSPDEPWGIFGSHDTDPTSFSEHDVNFVQSVATILATAIKRHSHEQKLLAQREQLAELNNINRVIRGLTDAVIGQSTREEIEQTVCDCLAEADPYGFAWIAEVDAQSEQLLARAEAGVEGYLDDTNLSVDPDETQGQGPAGRAVRTGEIQITQDVLANPDFEPWQAYAEAYGYQSMAAIPIAYEETFYGLLGVYAPVPNAFGSEVRAVIDNLGEIVGHAIAATERKQALMSTELTELQVGVDGVLATGSVAAAGTITIEQAVPIGNGVFLEYGRADEAGVETLSSLVEQLPAYEALRLTDGGEHSRFELRVSEPPIISTLASHGGAVDQIRIEDGELRMTIQLPPTVAARRLMDGIRETYPTATLLGRRQITRSDETLTGVHRTLTETLTDRQRSALETAVYAGFFEWPKTASGHDIADSLGVSPPTFHQHLRAAQKKLFESILLSSSHQ